MFKIKLAVPYTCAIPTIFTIARCLFCIHRSFVATFGMSKSNFFFAFYLLPVCIFREKSFKPCSFKFGLCATARAIHNLTNNYFSVILAGLFSFPLFLIVITDSSARDVPIVVMSKCGRLLKCPKCVWCICNVANQPHRRNGLFILIGRCVNRKHLNGKQNVVCEFTLDVVDIVDRCKVRRYKE